MGESYLILLPAHGSLCDQLLGVFLQDRLLLLDLFVHQRLSEHRLVHLVMTHPTVTHLHTHTHCKDCFQLCEQVGADSRCRRSALKASCQRVFVCVFTDQVDHDIFVEGGSPLSRHLADVDDGFGVVGVHVEDGSVDDTSHVCGVRRGAGHARVGGEADLQTRRQRGVCTAGCVSGSRSVSLWRYLVVDHDVHGAVCGVGRQVGQVEGLIDDALTGERGVSVQQDGHHLRREHMNLMTLSQSVIGRKLVLHRNTSNSFQEKK